MQLKAARQHEILCELGRKFNRCYNIQLLVFTCYTFFWITCDIYALIVEISFKSFLFVNQMLWLFLNCFRFLMLIGASTWCSAQVKKRQPSNLIVSFNFGITILFYKKLFSWFHKARNIYSCVVRNRQLRKKCDILFTIRSPMTSLGNEENQKVLGLIF